MKYASLRVSYKMSPRRFAKSDKTTLKEKEENEGSKRKEKDVVVKESLGVKGRQILISRAVSDKIITHYVRE